MEKLYDRVTNEPQHVAAAYAKLLNYEKLTTSAAVVAVAVATVAAVGTSDASNDCGLLRFDL